MIFTPKYFIAVAGNIGAGKSTLTGMLGQHFGWQPFYEANTENPYLADFYADMPRWGFHSQVFFLGKRLEHHRQLLDHPGSAVQDRTIYEDAEVFACNLYQQGFMSERDYDAYRSIYQAISAFLPPPHLLVYLQASVDRLMSHIAQRGREFERNISREYLGQLNDLYEVWIDRWAACPVLHVDMNTLDFSHNPADFEQIAQQIEHTLTVKNL